MAQESIWDKLAKAETASSAQKGSGRKEHGSKQPTKFNTNQKKTVSNSAKDGSFVIFSDLKLILYHFLTEDEWILWTHVQNRDIRLSGHER